MKIGQKKVRKRLLLLLAALGMSSYSLGGYLARGLGQEELIEWDKVKSTFRDYLRNPVPEKAKVFLDTLPLDKTKNQTGDDSEAVDYIYNSYAAFEGKILAGDRFLIEAAFRLLNFSDGDFAEALDQMLGNLARERPRLYLEFLFKYRNGWHVKNVAPPILETYPDEQKEKIAEWKKRIKALKTVKETKYRQIRDDCIRILEEAIIKYQPK